MNNNSKEEKGSRLVRERKKQEKGNFWGKARHLYYILY
jgi:hypothetical protein